PYLTSTTLLAHSSLPSFTHPTTPEIYTLSLHDALPIFAPRCTLGELYLRLGIPEQARPHLARASQGYDPHVLDAAVREETFQVVDRKSTRLNSSHVAISYAVFCLKKKKMLTQDSSRTSS